MQDQEAHISQLFWQIFDENQENYEKTAGNQDSAKSISSATAAKRQCLCLENNDKNRLKEVDQMLSNVATAMENNDVSVFPISIADLSNLLQIS